MPDQIVFNDGLTVPGSLGVSVLSGALSVDYTNGSVTGSLSVPALGVLPAQTYTNLTLAQTGISNGVPSYALTSSTGLTQISVAYNGQLPTSATTSITALGTGLSLAAGSGAVTASVVCFAAGTLIWTPRGDVPVETLEVGDIVTTSAGEDRVIRWVGHRSMRRDKFADPAAVMPVRIAAGAFGPDLPQNDLVVSPGHALCVAVVDEVLIPANALVNGTTITRMDCEEVTYWHLELDSHDILLANGMPAEAYIDVGNRGFFAGLVPLDVVREARALAGYCRPFADRGPVVAAVRNRLRARAVSLGWTLEPGQAASLCIEADGAIVHPQIEGAVARFLLPAGVQDVWLVCDTNRPVDISDDVDARRLGVCIGGLTVDDGLQVRRSVGPADPMLATGFHPAEDVNGVSCRWTMGRAQLPAQLWDGCRHEFFLRIDFAGDILPRWAAPEGVSRQTSGADPDVRLRLVDKAA